MTLARARAFAAAQRLVLSLLQAPMAGVPSMPLALAVADAGGMASMGALLLSPDTLAE